MDYVVLDGGMGTLLSNTFNNDDRVLWSLKPYFTNKNDIKQCHRLFIENGADIIITNNYCATEYYLNKGNIDIRTLPRIIKDLAHIAREEVLKVFNRDILVFGSIPPCYESYNINKRNNINVFKHYLITYVSLSGYVDTYLFETISSVNELNIIFSFLDFIDCHWSIFRMDILQNYKYFKHQKLKNNKIKYEVFNKRYMSFCVNKTGKQLLDGTDLLYVVELLKKRNIDYIFFNCSPINYIDYAIDYINHTNIKIGAYPNKHKKTLDSNFKLEDSFNKDDIYSDISIKEFNDYKNKWIKKNVKIIGGCCGIDETYIRSLKSKL